MSAKYSADIVLIAGLGNPGEKYKYTRHNAGFLIIDRLLETFPGKFKENRKFSSIYWEGRIKGRPVILQKPMTFMNESGKAVKALAGFADLLPWQIMLIYDDVDLPLGVIRLRSKGSSGGHNGVESVIQATGTNNIPRLRIGIGCYKTEYSVEDQQIKQDNKVISDNQTKLYNNLKDYVLSNFSEQETKILKQVIETAREAVNLALFRGFNIAMNTCNKKLKEI